MCSRVGPAGQDRMKNLFSRNVVNELKKKPTSLQMSLSPLWRITQFGLLLPWCQADPADDKAFSRRISKSICTVSSIGNLFVTFVFSTFHCTQLVLIIGENGTFHDAIPYLIWGMPMVGAFFTQLSYLVYRNRYLAFFDDWNCQLERKFSSSTSKIQSTVFLIYLGYFCIGVWVIFDTIWLLCTSQANSSNGTKSSSAGLLILDFPLLQNLFPDVSNFLPGFLIVLSFLLLSFSFILNDIVPSFVYYHAAETARNIKEEIKRLCPGNTAALILAKDEDIQRVLSLYGVAGRLVSRADDLFGPLTVLNQGLTFFLVCAELFATLQYRDQMNFGELASFPVMIAVHLYRMLWTIIMTSQLHRSSGELRETVADIVFQEGDGNCFWPNHDGQHRQSRLLCLFLYRLDHHPLVARPLGIYKITASTLLSVSSLIITYTIMLYQSK